MIPMVELSLARPLTGGERIPQEGEALVLTEHRPLDDYLNEPVSKLIAPVELSVPPGQQERHRFYLLLVMALVHYYRNGNKRGRVGTYPLNENKNPENWPEEPDRKSGRLLGGDYLGHNIAAIAVDGDGHVIDFDFNHNTVLNSSVEHAESRLVRRVYSLAQIHDTWNVAPGAKSHTWPKDDYTTLANVTVYTSLEPCSQCAGIMALGRVWEVVYLQTDPGMYSIGNILRRLTAGTKLEAPVPISADKVGLRYFGQLNGAFDEFKRNVSTGDPFFKPKPPPPPNDSPPPREDRADSITSFLCTAAAQNIFGQGASEFENLIWGGTPSEHPEFQPVDRTGQQLPNALKNSDVIEEIGGFYQYATEGGRRGTPHRL
jgi:tRNA(Arg) A34 adenosine deaminase TadA